MATMPSTIHSTVHSTMHSTMHSIMRSIQNICHLVTRRPRTMIGSVLLAGGVACSNDTSTAAPTPLYWAFQLNQHAITMSPTGPGRTFQLNGRALSSDGSSLGDAASTTYSVVDNNTSLSVSPTGVITAINPAFGVLVIASHTVGGLTLKDTAVVNINNVVTPPVVGTFSIHPLQGANPSIDVSQVFPYTLATRVLDQSDTPIPNLVVAYHSSDTTIASVDISGGVVGKRPGTVTLTATASIYGTSYADSLTLTVTPPLVAEVAVVPLYRANGDSIETFSPESITVVHGATVGWVNVYGAATNTTLDNLPGTGFVDVVFDDSTKVTGADGSRPTCLGFPVGTASDGGNIPAFGYRPPDDGSFDFLRIYAACQARSFPIPGVYHYHSKIYGTRGVVVVQ